MTTHTRAAASLAAVLVASATIASLPTAGPGLAAATPDQSGDHRVIVTATYTGAGEVNATHRIWIWLFDTPDIGPGSMPIAEMSAETNGAPVTFAHVTPAKVWVAVAYDEKGGFTGNAPPPSGSPIAIYGAKPGVADPVEPGPKARAAIKFDASQRMQ